MTGDKPALTVLRMHMHGDPPGRYLYALCRATLAARLIKDAEGSGDEVTDVGADALATIVLNPAALGRGGVLPAGVVEGGVWRRWFLPGEPPPVPGSPEAAASRN